MALRDALSIFVDRTMSPVTAAYIVIPASFICHVRSSNATVEPRESQSAPIDLIDTPAAQIYLDCIILIILEI